MLKQAPRSSKIAIGLLCFLLGGGCYGVVRLMQLRFESGDIYPEYSSLRSDPLGTRVLFESLARLDEMTVRRNHRDLRKITVDRGTVLFVPGLLANETFETDDLNSLESAARAGNRIILAYRITPPDGKTRTRKNLSQEKGAARNRLKGQPVPSEDPMVRRWGLRVKAEKGNLAAKTKTAARTSEAPVDLPETLRWRSDLVLEVEDPAWRTIYDCDGRSVMAERTMGAGSLVLVSDSYLLSNEAMLRDRHPEVIAWLLRSGHSAVFDEAHFGILDKPGIAALIRRYGLYGLVASLTALAGLFIWKNAVGFEASSEIDSRVETEGRGMAEGFVNLLRRNIPPAQLIPACCQAWRGEASRQNRIVHLAEVEAVAKNSGNGDPVQSYRLISKMVNQKSRSHE